MSTLSLLDPGSAARNLRNDPPSPVSSPSTRFTQAVSGEAKREEDFYTFSYSLKSSQMVSSRAKTKALNMVLTSVLSTYPVWELAKCSLRSLDGP